jgi:ribonuclease HI
MSELVAYVDGGSHGNPGPSGIGVVIEHPDGGKIRIAKWIGRHDNNVAEYAALLEALYYALDLNAKALHVFSDSQVVVRQMNGEYVCRSARLYSLHWICRKLARSLEFSIAHVPREDNAEANRLANSAVRKRFLSAKARVIPLKLWGVPQAFPLSDAPVPGPVQKPDFSSILAHCCMPVHI